MLKATRFSTDDAAVAGYLSDIVDKADPGLLAAALGAIAVPAA